MNTIHTSPPALVDLNVCIGPLPTGDHVALDLPRLRAQMQRWDVRLSVVHHSWAVYADVRRGNEAVLSAVAAVPDLLPACVVVPLETGELGREHDVESLLAASSLSLAHPVRHGWRLGGREGQSLLAALSEHGLPLVVPMEETTLPDVDAVADRHPELPLILTRVGYRNLRSLTSVLIAHPSVYCDLSYFAAHQAIEELAERVDRCPFVYASSSPHCDPAGSVARLRWSGADTAWRAAIAHETAQRLLGLPPGDRSTP